MQRRLRRATLSGGYLQHYIRAVSDSLTIVAFSQQQIMGWVFVLSVGGENNVNTFVNERYRNRGIATHLIEQTLEIYPEITLFQWDVTTEKLFRKLQERHPEQIRIRDWWREGSKLRKMTNTSKNKG